ncbi:FimD/PapC C-terminal domain-containing protein [Escherichia coli]
MVAARFNANIGYRVLVTVSDRNGKPLPFGALASNDETGQQSIVDEGGILYLSGISSKSQSWTVRWGNQADQQCQFAFSTPDSEPTTSDITRHGAVPLRIKNEKSASYNRTFVDIHILRLCLLRRVWS